MSSEARLRLLGAIVLAGLGAFVMARIRVNADVTHFLPGGEADPLLVLSRQLASSELSRTMILLVEADGASAAASASRELEAALLAEPRVASELAFIDAGPPEGTDEALWGLYQPRRFAFLAADPAGAAARTTPEALREAAAKLKRRLALPISTLVSRVAPSDPLLILPDLFERLAGSGADGLTMVEGRFVTEDGRGAVLFVGTRSPPFDSQAQRPFLAGVQGAFDTVNARHGGTLTLLQTGANRFAIRAEDAIRADVQRVSLWSVGGLVLLFLVLFRSLRVVALMLIVGGAGFLAGTAACLAIFGVVHGLTLAFGSALIGVSVDYTIHFWCHQTLAPHPRGPRRTLAAIWPGLVLGAATTIVGFLALVVSSFPGLRELAIFGAFGIAASLIATRVFLPGLVPEAPLPTRACRKFANAIERVVGALARRRGARLATVGALLALIVVGLPRARWNDDINNLNRLDPALVLEDAAIRERVIRYEQRRFVVAQGADEQAALEVNDRVADAVAASRDAAELGGFRSLASLLPAAARQQAVDAAARGDNLLWPRMESALVAEGFVAEAFAPFREALAQAAPTPLQWSDLAASPLAPLVRPFRVSLGAGVGLVTFLHDLRDSDALEQRLAVIDGARLVDIGATLTGAYGAYRERMTLLLLVGVVAVIALVALRHRRLRPTITATLPALLAAAGTVAVLALIDVELNVLALVALLMVVSMGDDYGIFLAEAGDDRDALAATQLAVAVAGLTTILGFALLAMSDHPALFAIGATTGIGVTLCLILAPATRMFIDSMIPPTEPATPPAPPSRMPPATPLATPPATPLATPPATPAATPAATPPSTPTSAVTSAASKESP